MVNPVIDKQRVSIQVARAVQDTIVAMKLKAGDRLPSQAQLAKQLSVSVPTLREGLERLELMGLVRVVHGTGTIVAEPSGDDLSRVLTPFLSRQPQPHQELIELLRVLQSAVMRTVAREGLSNDGLDEQIVDVESSADADTLAQNLIRFFRRLCLRYSNQTVLSLVSLVHELILFRANEKGVLWARNARIKALCGGVIDALRLGDEAAVMQHMATYSELLTWEQQRGRHIVALGTGSAGGSFDRFGARLCTMFGEQSDIRIEPVSTGGGIENIDLTDLGRVGLSITQLDVAHSAFTGSGMYSRPRSGVQAVCRLTPLNLWAVVRADSSIRQLTELKRARISAGAVGSDAAMVTGSVLSTVGISPREYRTFQLSLLNAVHALRMQEIDAFFYLSQNPFVALDELSHTTAVRVLPVPADVVEAVTAKHRSWQLSHARFSAGLDAGQQLVPTIGMPTLLVAHKRVAAEIVEVVAEVIEQNAATLFNAGEDGSGARAALFQDIPIPLHEGVNRYLKRESRRWRQ